MSKERKLRREERERAAAEAAAARAAEAERQAKREARVRLVTSRLPQRRHSRQTGLLAERRRNQVGVTFALLVALNLLVFALEPDWSLRALVLVASVLAAPVVYTMLFRRR